MTTELQQNRYDVLLRRVGDLKGPGSKVAEVLAELFPTFDVETRLAELAILSGVNICTGGAQLADAGVGLANRLQVFNPANSGILCTITRVTFAATTSGDIIRMATANTAVGVGLGLQRFMDTRRPFTGLPVCFIAQQQDAALTDADVIYVALQSETNTLDDPNGLAVLAPGFGFTVGNSALDIGLTAQFWWRERPAEPSEVNF